MKILSVKIKHKNNVNYEYKNQFSLEDFKQIALLLNDLEIYGANISKAFAEFKRQKKKPEFPW